GPDAPTFAAAAIWVIPLEGGAPRRITDGKTFDFNPTFDADGRSVIFSRWDDGRANLWEISIDSGVSAQLTLDTDEGENLNADVSPDGRSVVYLHERKVYALRVYSLEGVGRILSRVQEKVTRVKVSPDGRLLIASVDGYWAKSRTERSIE